MHLDGVFLASTPLEVALAVQAALARPGSVTLMLMLRSPETLPPCGAAASRAARQPIFTKTLQ